MFRAIDRWVGSLKPHEGIALILIAGIVALLIQIACDGDLRSWLERPARLFVVCMAFAILGALSLMAWRWA